ncbi:MAG: phytanoyl-CoA dioxygenase family protein [Deltaproteobacteria bacterium]|nr:phytanoyl-CoA dioxygenase family protein [Deltaproteobacteria bacterium]MCB9788598.1 phytanoyl-CoA dioxygenase family protein [Deltaproteobacteria bacterium]
MTLPPPPSLDRPLSRGFVDAVCAAFERDGYLAIEGALSPGEVAAANAALDRLPLPDRGDLRPLVDRDPLFLDHIDHPRILPYVLALLGGAIQVMGSSVTVISPGAGPMVWHEDGPRPFSYPAVGERRPLVICRAGIFLEDLRGPDRGQLVVVPGSHRVPFHQSPPPDARGALPGARALEVAPGTAVLFHNALWHSTAWNHMAIPRRALYYAYTPVWHRVVDYVLPPAALLDAIAAKPAARRPLLRQLVGALPEDGAGAFMFPDPTDFPGLTLVAPEHPASGGEY